MILSGLFPRKIDATVFSLNNVFKEAEDVFSCWEPKKKLWQRKPLNFSVFVTPAISNSLGTGEKSFDFKNNIGDYKRGL